MGCGGRGWGHPGRPPPQGVGRRSEDRLPTVAAGLILAVADLALGSGGVPAQCLGGWTFFRQLQIPATRSPPCQTLSSSAAPGGRDDTPAVFVKVYDPAKEDELWTQTSRFESWLGSSKSQSLDKVAYSL